MKCYVVSLNLTDAWCTFKVDDHPKLKQFSTSKTICMHGACIYPFLLCLHIFLRKALLTDESNVNTFDTNYFVIEISP